jgi:hypothetical protein
LYGWGEVIVIERQRGIEWVEIVRKGRAIVKGDTNRYGWGDCMGGAEGEL